MQSGRRLVQNIKDSLIFRPRQVRRQFQPLRFAPRKRRRGLPQPQVAETHFIENSQLRRNFWHSRKKHQRLADRELQNFMHIFFAVANLQHAALKSRTAALLADQFDIRQQTEIAELSTPVVKLWQGVLALPLIGTLDSARTQVVMENLLESIVRYEADIAIIDITGVPTVDTLVAQHLLKTVAAARLMGADCIISGIRPQIAQTMVHLGVELNVISKANLSDAFALALRRLGKVVVNQRRAVPTEPG